MKGQSLIRRIGFALNGLRLAVVSEHSFRLQLLGAGGVVTALVITHSSPLWWAVGALAVGLILVAELLNTAIEALADRLHPEMHPDIQRVKDVAAGAVLVASLIAVAVAIAFLLG